MRLARHATLALFAASLLAACGTPRDVDEDRIGARSHDVPFGDAHATSALADIGSCTRCHGTDYDGGLARSCTACHAAQLGSANWATDCTFCHGTPNDSGHQAHLVAGTYSSALGCSSCHSLPPQTAPESLAHVDGSVDVEFSTTARKGVTSPGYAGAGGNCTVYCHGSTALLGNKKSPAWTSTAPLTCSTCHSATPSSGEHLSHRNDGYQCFDCHPGYDNSPPMVDLAKHVNGRVDTRANGTWQNENGCDGGCH
jgi:predicted CxxxxCH...CXXCH cytochrome family protein